MLIKDIKRMHISELLEKASALNIENAANLSRQELVYGILQAQARISGEIWGEGVLHDNAALQRTEEPGKVHKRQRRKKSRRAGNDEENERAVNGFLGRDRGEDQKEKRDQDAHIESERSVNSRIALHRIGLGAIDSLRIGNGVDLAGENGIGGGGAPCSARQRCC